MNIDKFVLAAQQGDRDAATYVIESFRPLVEAAAAQSYLQPVAEEALAEARLSLWLAIRSFDPQRGVPFAGFAKAKVYHDLYSFFRHERQRWEREFLPEQYPDEDGGTAFDHLADEHDGTREFIACRELLDPLTPRQRQLIRLTVIEGYTQREAAKMLHLSQTAVAKGVHKALARLRSEA